MTTKQTQEYIRLKLLGCLDSKAKLSEVYKINEKDIESTIGKYIQSKLSISEEDYNELQRTEGEEIQYIKSLFSEARQEGFGSIENFYDWYKSQKQECCYCGVKTNDLITYFHQDNLQYKTARQRGKVLEIERVVTAPKDKNIYSKENCKLACYVCNNAKSDFISPMGFKPIAKGISEFWIEQGVNVRFPENSSIWEA